MSGDVSVGVPGAAVGIIEEQTQQPAGPPYRNGVNVGTKTDAWNGHLGRGGQNFFENGLGLLVVGVLGKR